MKRLSRAVKRVAPGYKSSAPEPFAVAEAIEQALFSESPKKRYLVVPNRGTAGWVTWSLVADLPDLNIDADYGFSREDIIDLLDREIAFRAGDEAAFDQLTNED